MTQKRRPRRTNGRGTNAVGTLAALHEVCRWTTQDAHVADGDSSSQDLVLLQEQLLVVRSICRRIQQPSTPDQHNLVLLQDTLITTGGGVASAPTPASLDCPQSSERPTQPHSHFTRAKETIFITLPAATAPSLPLFPVSRPLPYSSSSSIIH
jgi:hypothetical protein